MNQLILDRSEFESQFPKRPFVIHHKLNSHPLFDLARLVELSKALPAEQVEYNSGKVSISLDPAKTPRTGLSVEETIRRIEECQSWMALKNVEIDPEYSKLLNDCLEEIGVLSDPVLGSMSQKEGFIFISSPKSVTPYHMDPEHNFLLQVRGEKIVHMFDANDRSVLSEEELEGFHGGGHRNLVFKDEYQKKATSFTLMPGDALHFPVTAPHWVQNCDQVSISFSITFRSAYSERAAKLYYLNSKIRKLGLAPTPPGSVSWRDNLKYGAFKMALSAKHALGMGSSAQSARY